MTSRRASFAVVVSLDEAAVRRINSRLLELGEKDARNAMRRGFGRWSRAAKKLVEQYAPFGRSASTEQVRGTRRPNVHLKFSAATKVKGYRKGLVQWCAVGIKEITGSYLTPHWYLRWVENGHALRRKATESERLRAFSRGENPRTARSYTYGYVRPNPFIRRAAQSAIPLVEPMMLAEIEKAVRKANG